MNKFFAWCDTYKKQIGYTVGAMNILAAGFEYSRGQEMNATVWITLVIGLALMLDASRG